MTRRSFLIGVRDYSAVHGLDNLQYAHADVDLMAEIFSDPKLMGDPDPQVICLHDPTMDEARKAFDEFLSTVHREDTIAFYFSGHGMRDLSGDLHLCMTDTNARNLSWTAIDFQRIAKTLEQHFLQRVLILLDCCYSGAAGLKDSVQSQFDAAERSFENGKGIFVLSSAGRGQVSREADGYSVFTRQLADGIKSGEADRDRDGLITVQEISDHLVDAVPRAAPGQKPQISARAASGTFVIAMNPVANEDLDARREEAFSSAKARLRAAWEAGDADEEFFLIVMNWMKENPEVTAEDERFLLLEAYGRGTVGLISFFRSWQNSKKKSERTASGKRVDLVDEAAISSEDSSMVSRPDAPEQPARTRSSSAAKKDNGIKEAASSWHETGLDAGRLFQKQDEKAGSSRGAQYLIIGGVIAVIAALAGRNSLLYEEMLGTLGFGLCCIGAGLWLASSRRS